jgi:TPR repeat protein
MLWPRDETPPGDRPQVVAPVPWPAPDAGRDLANTPRDAQTNYVPVRSVVSAPGDTASLRGSLAAESQTAPTLSTAPRINDEEIASRLTSGRNFLIIGDVTAARLAFRRAADSGDAQAALALGGTFDPLVLKSLGAVGVAADPATARSWYQKAAELGSRDAPQRLNQLAQPVR